MSSVGSPSEVTPDVLKRSIARERRARKEAESLLEQKSRELYDKNVELQEIAAAHHETAKMSSTILETAVEGIITFDGECRIETANPSACKIFGYTKDELIGMDIRELRTETEEPTGPKARFSQSRTDELVPLKGLLGKRKDGTVFEMDLSGSKVQLEDRDLYTWLVRDTTNRRNLERQLAFAQKMESVGQLAAGVAHEINTPIQYVGDNTSFLGDSFGKLISLFDLYERLYDECREGDLHPNLCTRICEHSKKIKLKFLLEEIPEAISESVQGTSRVAEIVRAMKEFSHPGSAERTPTDINKAIKSTITISRHEWKYIAEVETDFDKSLPLVPCLPGQLNQALLNLIVNATHAIAESKGPNEVGTIRLKTRLVGDWIEISVSDTGCGMNETLCQKIFEPFFTTKSVGIGTGQGLSIVYSVIVEKHGGTINVESAIGEGTTFSIRLPVVVNDESLRKEQ